MQPGLHFNVSMDLYQAHHAMSKSTLDIFNSSPKEYKRWLDGFYVREQTRPMLMGSMLHGKALEDREDWIVLPEEHGSARTNAAKAWMAEQTAPILTRAEEGAVLGMAESIRTDPFASSLMARGKAEVSILSEYAGRPFKGRADWLNIDEGYFLDIKTTTDASTHGFGKEIANRRYHYQFSLYWKLLAVLGYEINDAYFVAVEKVEPYRVNVRKLKPSAMEVGMQEIEADLELLESCERTGIWPGLSGPGPKVQEIDIPAWKYSGGDALELTIGGQAFTT